MEKTLGGDRLGSGNKQKVQLHHYERSTHDLGYIFRSTMAAGTLVPFMNLVALPGDTFDIDLNCNVKTHPTIGPLFGSYKVQLDVFFAPIRLYIAALHNNKLGIGLAMSNIKLPIYTLNANIVGGTPNDYDNTQINPSCIFAYLGVRGVGTNSTGNAVCQRDFNAVPWLAYWDIYKQYYANKMEDFGYVINTLPPPQNTNVSSLFIKVPGTASTGIPQTPTANATPLQTTRGTYFTFTYSSGTPNVNDLVLIDQYGNRIKCSDAFLNGGTINGLVLTGTWNWDKYGAVVIMNWDFILATELPIIVPKPTVFALSNIDTMREKILQALPGTAFSVNTANLEPWILSLQANGTFTAMMGTQQGLGLKTYQSDLFNNWIKTSYIDTINSTTAVSTAAGSFTIDALQLARKVYDLLNRIAVSGGTYDDWLDAVYTQDRIKRAETPIYYGGLSKELVFQEVVSNSEAQGANGVQPLGTLAGKGVMADKHKGGQITIKVDEPGYIMGIVSLTPRLDYSQGNDWDTGLMTMDDLHKPGLDNIGFQDLITEQMAWWNTIATTKTGNYGNWLKTAAGKQPAWMNYRTNVNRIRGNFAVKDNEMFMVLNRRYEPTGGWQIKDLTTYIDPAKFNHIFAETSRDAQNFWTQISCDITARRKLTARVMPNL